ncbi:hypothetical protein NSK_007791, partial [Nannochloropsis salina CCMP1776]
MLQYPPEEAPQPPPDISRRSRTGGREGRGKTYPKRLRPSTSLTCYHARRPPFTDKERDGREGGGGGGGGPPHAPLGLASLPRRVGSTLKRKFWDSNDLVSSTAVQARDILATLYVNGRESTVQLIREGSHRYDKYGRLCCGQRIDYSLQEKEIEITNEYIFALGG